MNGSAASRQRWIAINHRVVIADDQTLVRAGFRMILDSREDLEVVGEAADGATAVDVVAELVPDVVLMDVRMPAPTASRRPAGSWPPTCPPASSS